MGSTGPDFRCPLCGKRGSADHPNNGYSVDWIGYPTRACCNFKEVGGIFDGGTPTMIKAEQLSAIFLLNKKDTAAPQHRGPTPCPPQWPEQGAETLTSRTIKNNLMKIAIFLLPEKDETDIFRHLSNPQ